jgi:alanine racemase
LPLHFSKIISLLKPLHHILRKDTLVEKLIVDTRIGGDLGNALFFALKTSKRDGHDFISDAYAKGIRNFIVSRGNVSGIENDCNYCVVEDPLKALQLISKAHRIEFNLRIIAITGSNGKTIVKEWLSEILNPEYSLVKSPKSYNSQIGVPLSVWQINESHQLGIFEAGISEPGEMQHLHEIIQPECGILTNIGPAHDENFKDREQKLKEKLELFRDCKYLIVREEEKDLIQKYVIGLNLGEIISWGKNADNTYIVKTQKIASGINIQIGDESYHVAFSDPASLENITHCIIAARVLNVRKNTIDVALPNIHPVPMRLEVKEAENNCIIIDDTYNHDLAGLGVALAYLSGQYSGYKKSVIISEINQSGLEVTEQIKKLITTLSSLKLDKILLVGSSLSDHTALLPNTFVVFPDTESVLRYIRKNSFSDSVVLIKGARKYRFERIVQQLEKKIHGTRLEISLSALNHNLSVFKRMLGPNTKMMVMVKAFAYGVGSREVANFLEFNKVDYLGVAYASEGVALRKLGVRIPIFVMNPSPETLPNCFEYDLEPEIYSFHSLSQFLKEFSRQKKELPVHINIDTGMNRLGFVPEEIGQLADIINDNNLKLASVFSHLASSDEDRAFSLKQISDFESAFDALIMKVNQKPLKHILNSAGIVNFPEYQFDMVRLGIGLYGVNNAGLKNNPLLPIGKLVSEISQVKKVGEDDTIGYGRKGKLGREGKIATIPIGYADGFSRIFSNRRGKVLINGKSAEVVGNVCMDMIMVDITDIEAREGDEVIIFGEGLPIEELASLAETIPYEILTNISERVKRVYFND